MFAVGSFAGLAGISAKTLRLYDRAGVFRPAWTDVATGYRYYSAAQLPQLRRIVALRDTGMSLADIARLRHTADLRDALEARRHELEAQRAELERRLAALAIRVDTGDETEPDVVVRTVEAQLIASRPVGSDDDVSDAFFELERHVRDAGARAARPPGAIIGDRTDDTKIFVPIRRAVAVTKRITVERLPAARAATALHHGAYAGLAGTRAALDRWIERAGMQPSGPLRILYLQFGAETELRVPAAFVVERSADFVTELQRTLGPA